MISLGNNKNKIVNFTPFCNYNKTNLKFANEISFLKGIKKIVLLPDSFTKEKYIKLNYKATVPSSSVIVSDKEYFYPQLRSRGINCGMMSVLLPITKKELNNKFIKSIQSHLTHGFLYYLFYRIRLPFLKKKRDINKNIFLNILSGNINDILDKDRLLYKDLSHIKKVPLINIKKYISKKWIKRSVRMRYFFGRYFGGNHFFEIQEVVNIDKDNKNISKIKKGQLVITFHTAGEAIQDILSENIKNKYILQKKFISINDKKIHNIFFNLNTAIMNLGYAYRLVTFNLINDALKESYGSKYKAEILIDKCHNSFSLEKINNINQIVYRHNAEKILPGELGILAGNFNHNSYIVEGLENLKDTFFTMDHGIGNILNVEHNNNKKINEKVIQYKFKKGIKWLKEINNINIIKNEKIDILLNYYKKKKILKPIIELKPLINIKNK